MTAKREAATDSPPRACIARHCVQIVIGPYVIDAKRNVRVIDALLKVRIGAMAEHLTEPETKVYMVSMDGPFYEVDLTTLEATLLFNLVDVLDIPISQNPYAA